jgi:polyisoprenoid-binding protein YceI
MKLVAPIVSVLALAALLAVSLGTAAQPARAAADTYDVDTAHSYVGFRIQHMGVAWSYGRFNEFSGKVTWDPANPSANTISMEVKTASIDTGNSKRDDHLRNPDYFNAPQFPTLTFKSTSAKKVDDKHFEVTGDLSMHGQTKSVTFRVEQGGPIKDPWGFNRAGFFAEFPVKRSDFGIGKPEGLSDEVLLTISFEIAKK